MTRLEISAKRHAYYIANREKIKKLRREYYLKNKTKELAQQHEYREKSREVIRAKNRAYNSSDAGKAREKRYKQSERGKAVMAHWKKVWQQNHDKKFKYTITKGKMKINFIRENKQYFYVVDFGGHLTKSNPYTTLGRCRYGARCL